MSGLFIPSAEVTVKYLKFCLALVSILAMVLESHSIQSKPLIENICQQVAGKNSSSKMVQVTLVDESTASNHSFWMQLAQGLGLEPVKDQKKLRWNCQYIENDKWFSLFDLSVEPGKQVITSTFLPNGKFKSNQKKTALSFFTTVISQTLSLGEKNQKKVNDALAGYLTLIDQGGIIPEKVDQRILSKKLHDFDIPSSQIPSKIPNGWLTHDAIAVDRLVIFDGKKKPQAVAFVYMVPIIDTVKKNILQWGINITISITPENEKIF